MTTTTQEPALTPLVEAMAFVRDKDGWWTHPGIPDFDENAELWKKWIAAQGLETTYSALDDEDDEHPVRTTYFENGEPDVSGWNPTPPVGDGWFTFSIHDTEDGPVWVWARRGPYVSPLNPVRDEVFRCTFCCAKKGEAHAAGCPEPALALKAAANPSVLEARAAIAAALINSQQSNPPLQQGSPMSQENLFVTAPEVTLPNGVTVPSFQVGQYLCAKGEDGAAVVSATAAPWVHINYSEAGLACAAIGGKLITELQYLAIAHDIAAQGINWTGGAVGEGNVFQGLHEGNVDEAQPGDFVSDDADERRWHQLSNGEKVFDFAGNAYTWVFDDVQGDERGLVAKAFAEDSPSIAAAPFPCMENGMGWRPDAGSNWSGYALVRGGCWGDGDGAGVFVLDGGSPDYRVDRVGFRCTK